KEFIAFIAKTVNPKSPAAKLSKDNRFEHFHKKYFPNASFESPQNIIDQDLVNTLRGKRPFEKARLYKIKKLAYNPTKLLTVINDLNSKLKHFDLDFQINNRAIPYENFSRDNDYVSYLGPQLDVKSRPILFKNVSLMELIKYIDFTLALSVKEVRSSLVIEKGLKGKGDRPYYFKQADEFVNEIKQSTLQARAKYDKKPVQIKGYVTEIKALSDKLLVEVNNHFVVEIDNKHLKRDTIKNLTEHLKEMKTNPAKAQKFLKVTLRGTVAIKTVSRTFITGCSSLMAEEAPYFYTTF
ncbi:MAG: hypothetical protein NE330_19775, partial [Lentisphaeraceae bacterium]|nr:hypothetical protein [Lentisphaeraceae bacterium]